MDTEQFESRKRDHIRHALNPEHQAQGLSGLDRIHLNHEALPDLNFDQIRLETPCLGQSLATPFYVAGMTAGHSDAVPINRVLALACQNQGWAMGVGSQRRDLETGNHGTLDQWRRLRQEAPRLTLFANLGISQIVTAEISEIKRLVESIEAQALVIHANPLQESLQPEGTPRFRGSIQAMEKVCKNLGVPVVLKETGCGFSEATLRRISNIGLAAIDVSGLGGTHWGRIEGARSGKATIQAMASDVFADWGEPTADSVLAAAKVLHSTEIWASGGVRTGLDAAKLIALGAHRVGYAKPALEAALIGADALQHWMEIQEYSLKVALFCTGSETPLQLRQKDGVWKRNDA